MYKNFERLVLVLLIAGALNWGSLSLNGPDFVSKLGATPERLVKGLVGLAGLYALYKVLYTLYDSQEV